MPRLVIIAGPNFSGCSTLADALSKVLLRQNLSANVVSLRDYQYGRHRKFRPDEFEYMVPDPEEINFSKLKEDIYKFSIGIPFRKPQFDTFRMRRLKKAVTVMPADYLIVEGSLGLFDAEVVSASFINIYLDLDLNHCLSRFIQILGNSSLTLQYSAHGAWRYKIRPNNVRNVIPTVSNAVCDHGIMLSGKDELGVNLRVIMEKMASLIPVR